MAEHKIHEHHEQAAQHYEHAAKHHREAAKHHKAGNHEKAAHHARIAFGHYLEAAEHQNNARQAPRKNAQLTRAAAKTCALTSRRWSALASAASMRGRPSNSSSSRAGVR